MKRTLATLGAVGLAALAVAAPATADNNNKSFCHAVGNGYLTVSISSSGFEGHDRHDGDIIPPGEGLPDGLNWDTGKAIFANGCVATVPAPPVVVDTPVTPPAEEPVVEQPVVVDNSVPEQPVVQPLTEAIAETPSVEAPAAVAPAAVTAQPAPAKQVAAAPKAAPKAAPAAAPVSVGTNQGYNAQTAVGAPDAGPGWLAGAAALAAAGAAVAVRRRPRPLHTGG
ncbi:MYXO-CTERM domain-containing protein [Arthrobacter ulcerisalmonis]|nr:hypothetical protein [Arthrobacter ulcerisalmonis]MDQ0662343.1 MYXO-CTERM domain-containing protein [Arthrobacter ulcerisalmonis]